MTKGYTKPTLLLRVDSKERIESICLEGHIFMRMVNKYHTKANENPNESISDFYDGKGSKNIHRHLLLDINNDGNVKSYFIGTGKDSFTRANQCIFSMIGVRPRSLKKIRDNEYRWTLPWSVIEGLLGERKACECAILIIWDTSIFVERWKAEIEKRGLSAMWGFVEYDDLDFKPKHDTNTQMYALECCFHKEMKFARQQEYRFAACANESEDIKDLRLGELDKNTYQACLIDKGKDLVIKIEVANNQNIYYLAWVQGDNKN